jgi:isopentenyl-diphosphate Delta-isomerase
MTQEFVILVDENDNETGVMEKMEAHEKAVLHRAVSVFIFNSKGEWLLQQRAFEKYHSGGLWTNTCCSHPFPGEKTIEAATRRLTEEMGLTSSLKEIFSFKYFAHLENGLSEHELDHVFVGFTDSEPLVNDVEAEDWRYLSTEKLELEMKAFPQNFTVWFKLIFVKIRDYLQNNKTDI